MMTYKGFIGSVEYDDEAHIFSGEVINTRTVITFQGTTVDEIENAFHDSVDDYLEWCKEAGKEPEKEFRGMFNVRISPDSHREAAMEAAIDGITMNQFVSEAIEEKIARKKAMLV